MLERQTTRREVQTIPGGGLITLQVPFGQIRCPEETIKRVIEWSMWAKARVSLDSHGRCASAEGNFESEYPDAARSVRFEVDLLAVLQVEKIVCTKLPKIHKELVIRHFVKQDAPIVIARILAVPKMRYGDELKRAVLMLRNCLTRV